MKALQSIGIIVVILLFIVLVVVASTGLIKIPLITPVFGFDKAPDLGVKTDTENFNNMLLRENVILTDPVSNYCLTCEITYSNSGPMDITVSSTELSSYLQATNNEKGPLKDIQVKLGDANQAELAAYADLREFGYDFSGPVYSAGQIEKDGSNRLRLDITRAKVGLVPVPKDYAEKGEKALEDEINDQLASMPGLRIDSLSIDDGSLRFVGNFPKQASAK